MAKDKVKLTDKQKAFCLQYLIDLNATQAAIRAGYSEATANRIASDLLSKVDIQNRISELKAKRNERLGITSDQVVEQLKNYAYSDITETMNLTFEEVKELPIDVRRLITSFKKTTTEFGTTYEIKFVDKMRAWEMLNRHIGFYEVDNIQKAQPTLVINTSSENKDDINGAVDRIDHPD